MAGGGENMSSGEWQAKGETGAPLSKKSDMD